MIHDFTKGYIFEAKQDNKGNIGVMTNFKVFFRHNFEITHITCVIDLHGKLLVPAFVDINNNFLPLYNYITDTDTFEEDIRRFVRSNKPSYGVSQTYLVCNLKLVYNMETKELDETQSEFNYYAPRRLDQDGNKYFEKEIKGNFPVLICDKLTGGDSNESMFLLHQEQKVLDAYTAKIKQQLNCDICSDRFNYLKYMTEQKDR